MLKLPFATNFNIEIAEFALYALGKIFVDGYFYKKMGVVVMDISHANMTQSTFFKNSDPRHKLGESRPKCHLYAESINHVTYS